jgi:hypothetical protein
MVTVTFQMMTHLTDGTIKDHPEDEITFVYGVERRFHPGKGLEKSHVGDRKCGIPSG